MRDWDHYRFFPPSQPLEAKGGIKAQSKRGGFAQSWWARRWIAVLESFEIGARLQRGRSYARRGQVLSISIEKGLVKAAVQGSRPKPYNVKIQVQTLNRSEWQKLAATLSRQAIFAAKLLSGEMPQEIEKVLAAAGLSLFPEKRKDLKTDCSCPDWSNPCKHVAAVYYLLGEEFDRDPFLIFKMRGLARDELVGLLGKPAAKAAAPECGPAEPLPAAATRFWKGGPVPPDLLGEIRPPAVSAALSKRLGNFPFWRGRERFLESLEPVYSAAAQRALKLLTE